MFYDERTEWEGMGKSITVSHVMPNVYLLNHCGWEEGWDRQKFQIYETELLTLRRLS